MNQLTDAERFVVESAGAGRIADFSGAQKRPELRALVLTQLLLGQNDPGIGRPWSIGLAGLRIRGADIVGSLDLRDAAQPGEGLPALVLEACHIPESIHLCAARLARLSIAQSEFTELCLNEANVDGPLDFSGAKSAGGTDGIAWIDARNALIAGQVTGDGARLRAVAAREPGEIRPGEHRAALWLRDAEIRGSVQLVNGFVAHGGVSLDTAQVRGDVRLTGAEVWAGEDDAFSAQNARIGGSLRLNRGFVAHGVVWLHSASINDELVLTRATLLGGTPAGLRPRDGGPERPEDRRSLVAGTTDVGADCWLRGATATSLVSLRGSRIRGTLQASDLMIRAGDDNAFDGDDMEISNGVDFTDARVSGSISLKGAEIGSSLNLDGARIGALQVNFTALDATNARVGADATFGQPKDSTAIFDGMGRLDLTGLYVRGNLRFAGCRVSNQSSDGTRIAIELERARIEGSLHFGSIDQAGARQSTFHGRGEVNVSGAVVGRDFLANHATFSNPGRSAIYAKDVQVGDDLRLVETEAAGDLRFERAEIAGSLKWDRLRISARRPAQNGKTMPAPAEFRRARIGSALKAELLLTVAGSAIDLRGLRVHEIEDWTLHGWGSPRTCNCCTECEIDFDGMVYERITIPDLPGSRPVWHRWEENDIPSSFPGPAVHPRGGLLLNWILHQRRPNEGRRVEKDHFPQPFRQLARVLRDQGEEEAARFITVSERWATPSKGLIGWVRRWFFGPLFEFGLSPKRGLITVLVYLMFGAFGVWLAKENNMLVETSMVASTSIASSSPVIPQDRPPATITHQHAFMTAMPEKTDTEELVCTDTATDVATDFVYAADMIVPFIPLHEETKCEISTERSYGAEAWRVGKALYTIVGWLIVSITLATFAGLLKRGAGEGD